MVAHAATPIRVMNIAQFTTEASEYAAKVDNLFYLLSIISGIIVLLVTGADCRFLRALLPRLEHAAGRGARAQKPRDRNRLDRRDALYFPLHLLVGGVRAADRGDAAEGCARDPRRRQTMDVAVPASERRARNQRAARARVHRCPAGDDVAGCHPRSLSAGTAIEAGHSSRSLHLRMVQGRQDWNLPFHLCRILRDRSFGHGRLARNRHAGRLCALDRGAAAGRRSGASGRGTFPLARLLRLSHAGLDGACS